jgi:hypothetical protein
VGSESSVMFYGNISRLMTSRLTLVQRKKLEKKLKLTTLSESASEIYRPSDRRLSAKLVPETLTMTISSKSPME